MTSTIPLATRVLDAFPSGQYGLIGLLRILDIVESDVVETAAIECTTLPLMRLNPTFVATFAQTAEKLMMLIMHELHHLLLGHTRLFERPTPAHNLVFDAVINAMLCRMFPQPEFTSFLTGFYDAERFPECMLRPPPNWKPEVRAAAPPALEPRLQDLYRALYSETGAGYDELFEALVTEVRCVALPVLLGDHGEELPQLDSSPVLFDAVRAIVERWPQPSRPIRGRSWAETLRSESVTIPAANSDAAVLATLIRSIARAGTSRTRACRGSTTEVLTAAERPDRRSAVLRALGTESLLFRTEFATPNARGSLEPVHLYLDVSGSVSSVLPAMYGATRACRDLLDRTVHLFSTAVHDMPLHRVLRGECKTTGGTDIGCVAAHMRERWVRRAVILTDGAVGTPAGEDAATLKSCVLGVALTPGYCLREDLAPYAHSIVHLRGEA